MAVVYRKLGGRKLTKVIAVLDGVQAELEARAFQIGVRAEQELINHRQDGHARIDVEEGKNTDYFVVLDDTRGLDAALSIEFGRAGYIDPETGQVKGAMDPLYILTDAAHLPRKAKRVPALKPYERKKLAKGKKTKKKKKRRSTHGGNPS